MRTASSQKASRPLVISVMIFFISAYGGWRGYLAAGVTSA